MISKVSDGIASVKHFVAMTTAVTFGVKFPAEFATAGCFSPRIPNEGALRVQGVTGKGYLREIFPEEAVRCVSRLKNTDIGILLDPTAATKFYAAAATKVQTTLDIGLGADHRQWVVGGEVGLSCIIDIHFLQEVEAGKGFFFWVVKAVVDREDVHLEDGDPGVDGLTNHLSLQA